MATGRVLRMERLSTYDGNGLRTVIFLKGCPLKCQWCSTPESQRGATDFGHKKEKCTYCLRCVVACPRNAISWDPDSLTFHTDHEKCVDCRNCVHACAPGSRVAHGRTLHSDDVLREVERDSIFYFHSGGGITISGGEPLVQKEFVLSILRGCRSVGINTALETSGNAPWETVEALLPFLDALYYDLKHMASTPHREITGVGNELILENLTKIDASAYKLPITVRMPLIPTLNDTDENLIALGWFCKKLRKLEEIQILPYHRLGIETYRQLSVEYALEGLMPPGAESIKRKVGILQRMGLKVKVGG